MTKRLLSKLSMLIPLCAALALIVGGVTGSGITVPDALLVLAGVLVYGAWIVGVHVVGAAREIGVAHVAAERVRAKNAAPELPDLGAMLGGLLGSTETQVATRAQKSGEALAAQGMERARGTVPLKIHRLPGSDAVWVSNGLLDDIERRTGKISAERLASLSLRDDVEETTIVVGNGDTEPPVDTDFAMVRYPEVRSDAFDEADGHRPPRHGIVRRPDELDDLENELDDPARIPPH
jgi:hypothetical protein